MKRKQAGFTLIELISVIVILGILSAFALPRFASLEVEARRATIEGLGGAMRSAVALAHAVWLAEGATGGGVTILMDGSSVALNSEGWPTSASIAAALQTDPASSGYSVSGNEYTVVGVTAVGSCSVTFIDGSPPEIQVNTTNCN